MFPGKNTSFQSMYVSFAERDDSCGSFFFAKPPAGFIKLLTFLGVDLTTVHIVAWNSTNGNRRLIEHAIL